ncbi:acetolactate decarboxylase [Staphylococcus nepalensis]|uniref:acetolactate decarboxylase n=1 Tax=Staphylococcus nepalensis TaxID=214473 RepID=UPI001E4377AE|nr:acetolactate decarboxylase [Staphylococcus nepalensis]MCD8891925.1 acetolactate decarboxylase [Staphylococcus nepalensis]
MLYQHGTLGTLMAGLLDGTMKINEVLKHGDLGIGTLTGSDGEVIILDGVAYHADAQGNFKQLNGDEMTPFSTVTPFKPANRFEVRHITDSDTLLDKAMYHAKSKNIFLAVKITGKFESVHVRMMPRQEKPYTKLIESAKQQPEYMYDQIEGTIVGFYAPQLFHGIAAGGFHLHFVDEKKTIGGHVLDFEMNHGEIEISNIETLEQHFPVNNQDFLETDVDYSTVHEDIKQSE